MLYSIDIMETDLLPALIIGYENRDGITEKSLERGRDQSGDQIKSYDDIPSWLVEVMQQAGGYSMFYPTFLGLAFRFEAHTGRVKDQAEAAEFLRGIRAMAEDPDMKTLAEFPVLKELVYTTGEEYNVEKQKKLQDWLGYYYDLPKIDVAWEAFVRFKECDPLDFFTGWNPISLSVNEDEKEYTSNHQGYYYVDDMNRFAYKVDETLTYDKKLHEELVKTANTLGIEGQPRIFLIWTNSD